MNARRWFCVIVCFFSVLLNARDVLAQRIAAEVNDADAVVEQWIEKLDARRFSDRVRAATELQRMGANAIEPLQRVVLQGSSEAAERALGILKRNFLSDNPQLSEPAQAALDRIAQSEGHPQSLAAEKILTPPASAPKPATRPRAVPIPVARMNLQIQMKNVNGKRDLQVTENGRKFRFRDQADGIAVERPDDQGGVKKTTYKDEADLKAKDPEAYKLFERYSAKNGNRIQIQFGQPLPRGLPRLQIQPRIELRQRPLPQLRRPQIEPPQQPATPRKTPPRAAPPRSVPKPKASEIIEV